MESLAARPRLEVAKRVVIARSRAEILKELLENPNRILQSTFLESDAFGGAVPKFEPLPRATLTIHSDRAGDIVLGASVDASALVILKDSTYPGWKAYALHR